MNFIATNYISNKLRSKLYFAHVVHAKVRTKVHCLS